MQHLFRGVLLLRSCQTGGSVRSRLMTPLAAQAGAPPTTSAAELSGGGDAQNDAASAEPSVIDESLFDKRIDLLALRVPAPLCSRVMSALRSTSLLFTHTKLPTVVDERPASPPPSHDQQQQQQERKDGASRASTNRPATKLVLLSPSLTSPAAFPAPLSSLVSEYGLSTTPHTVRLTYKMHSLDEVLSAVLPSDVPPPSSFETVGHLAHVNLLPAHLPYRKLIGAAITSHSPGIRCVVNKLSAISDEYRLLPLEVIAGEEGDTVTEVREHGCQFRFDYRLVYWNSRLATEHRRLVDLIRPRDTVVDMFAGIGPFVIPIAKNRRGKAGQLLANDKNVHSFEALRANCRLNGVEDDIRAFNFDARDFIDVVKDQLRMGQLQRVDHIIMNLPAIAITFIDCLRGIYAHAAPDSASQQPHSDGEARSAAARALPSSPPCPVVHVYCFSNADDKVADVISRIEAVIQHALPAPTLTTDMRRAKGSGGAAAASAAARGAEAAASSSQSSQSIAVRPLGSVERKRKRDSKQQAAIAQSAGAVWDRPIVHFVRNVAPNKDMLCVSFTLPAQVAFDTLTNTRTHA